MKVLVLLGGMSSEHDISMMSGRAVIRNLPAAGHEPVPAVIGRDGRFRFPPADRIDEEGPWLKFSEAACEIDRIAPDCVFIALHGTFGEDGRIQSFCDLMGLPYIGADSIGSAVGMDKWASKAIYLASGIPTADSAMLQGSELDDPAVVGSVVARLGYPVVLKATRQGSSVGVAIVRDPSALASALAGVRTHSDMVMFEQFKAGREFSVPVVEDPESGGARAFPIIEIVVHKADFFDYETKYDPNAADEICPALIDAELAETLSRYAVAAHRALMLSGYSRTDFIAGADGVWALETNTLPGLTEYSLLPKSAAVAGMTYPELLDVVIRNAVNR